MSTETATVFVVDDDAAVRDSLSLMMRSVDLQAETFESATDFLDGFDPQRAGCLVLDIRMPGISGMELHKKLNDIGSILPIIFITGHGDVPMAVEAMQRGAVDFLQKPYRDQDLLDRINAALDQDAETRKDLTEIHAIRKRMQKLTPREHEVMDLVVNGKPNKVVAADLGVSQRTVEIHRGRVMEKMRARSLAHLVRMVMAAKTQ